MTIDTRPPPGDYKYKDHRWMWKGGFFVCWMCGDHYTMNVPRPSHRCNHKLEKQRRLEFNKPNLLTKIINKFKKIITFNI